MKNKFLLVIQSIIVALLPKCICKRYLKIKDDFQWVLLERVGLQFVVPLILTILILVVWFLI